MQIQQNRCFKFSGVSPGGLRRNPKSPGHFVGCIQHLLQIAIGDDVFCGTFLLQTLPGLADHLKVSPVAWDFHQSFEAVLENGFIVRNDQLYNQRSVKTDRSRERHVMLRATDTQSGSYESMPKTLRN